MRGIDSASDFLLQIGDTIRVGFSLRSLRAILSAACASSAESSASCSSSAAVPIISGLRVGERVATVNAFVLKAELGKSEAAHDH